MHVLLHDLPAVACPTVIAVGLQSYGNMLNDLVPETIK